MHHIQQVAYSQCFLTQLLTWRSGNADRSRIFAGCDALLTDFRTAGDAIQGQDDGIAQSLSLFLFPMHQVLILATWYLLDPSLSALLSFSATLSVLAYIHVVCTVIMPSVFKHSPFVSLRPDQDCGREKKKQSSTSSSLAYRNVNGGANDSAADSSKTKSYTNGSYAKTNGYTNGYTNGSTNGSSQRSSDDEFLRLSSPQQDVLLLHGPRQKYSLEKAKDIPELRGDDEILVQVLAIGLNVSLSL
jgi:hypothetical protein